MADLTPETLADLRAKAMAATPGPWLTVSDFGGVNWLVAGFGADYHGKTWNVTTNGLRASEANGSDAKDDATFVAAANPATVLAMIDEIERLRAEIERMGAVDEDYCRAVQGQNELHKRIDDMFKDNERLRGKLALICEQGHAGNTELAAQLTNANAEIERLRRHRAELDCRYAGALAEASGSHCPLDRPCARCSADREIERLRAAQGGSRG